MRNVCCVKSEKVKTSTYQMLFIHSQVCCKMAMKRSLVKLHDTEAFTPCFSLHPCVTVISVSSASKMC